MKVIKADVLGMCFGVRDALAIIADVELPPEVTIHGELVHNEKVLGNLAERGLECSPNTSGMPCPWSRTPSW